MGKLDAVPESEKLSPGQMALVISAAAITIWDWEIEIKELIYNERWAQIIGYSLSELQPLTFETWSNFVHLDDIEKATLLLQEHWRGKAEL